MKWKEAWAAAMTNESLLDVAKRLCDSCAAAEKNTRRYPRNEAEENTHARSTHTHTHLAEHRQVRWIFRMHLINGVAPKSEDTAEADSGA